MQTISCDHRHTNAIREIFNEAIVNSTALYDYEPRSAETVDQWISAKQAGHYPIIGIESEQSDLLGFASYGPFRPWAGYKYSIEHTVYVDRRFRGQGLGRKLLLLLIEAATEQGFHTMIGGIDSGNVLSIALHSSLRFTHCATIREAGFKFDRWLDLHFYQLILTPNASSPTT